MFLMPTPVPFLSPTEISLVGSNESFDSNTVSFPQTAQAGDVIIVIYGNRTSVPPIPTGFTLIESVGSTNGIYTDTGVSASYLIASGGETQAAGTGTSWGPCLICAQYRCNAPVKTVTVVSSSKYSGSGNPDNDTTLAASGSTKPSVAMLGLYSGSTFDVNSARVNFNEPTGGTVELDVVNTGDADRTTLGYFLEADANSGSDVSVAVGDTGVTATVNALLEFS